MAIPIDKYREYLTGLVENRSPILFTNGGKEYASILMSILLGNTANSVSMFCEGFRPDLICESEYWEALRGYLSDPSKSIRVLVKTDSYKDEEPMRLLFDKKRERGDDSILVRLVDAEGINKIKKQFNGAANNFAVFDDSMFRLEFDPGNFLALGSFNRPKDAELLLGLFDDVFANNSTAVQDGGAR